MNDLNRLKILIKDFKIIGIIIVEKLKLCAFEIDV
jgi:hypothetical protein